LTLLIVATAQAASLKRVSLLKFEPKVSNFPVIKSIMDFITKATMQSHFYFERVL